MIIQQLNTNLIINADCLTALKELPDNSVDSIVTDPPYGLGFMGKQWDTFDKSQFGKEGEEGENDLKVKKNFKILPRYNSDGLYTFTKEWATECFRVLKHGGHFLCFSGTRNYHKICMGIEDAGFEIRDMISWIYGSGFPKSLNIAKAIEGQILHNNSNTTEFRKIKGETKRIISGYTKMEFEQGNKPANYNTRGGESVVKPEFETEEAKQWEGWGTALKPACEPIVVARKPLSEKNVALNCLKWGTGGINIDGCRVGFEGENINLDLKGNRKSAPDNVIGLGFKKHDNKGFNEYNQQGRFPANIILDEEAGRILDEQAPLTGAFAPVKSGQKSWGGEIYHKFETSGDDGKTFYGKGLQGASRFFYCAKASKSERNLGCEELDEKLRSGNNKIMGDPSGFKTGSGNERNGLNRNNHPTVKPIKLMEYLVRLVTPIGGMCLDPFLGSGTTACACIKEGVNYIGIEREEDYCKIARARIKAVEDTQTNYKTK